MTDTQSADKVTLLKRDLFGEIRLVERGGGCEIERDTAAAATWVRWIARRLLRREAEVLAALDGEAGFPGLIAAERDLLRREYLDGRPMQEARPRDRAYFRSAFRLLRRMHRLGVAHNDLAKEPNWLVRPDGQPALLDFQLAAYYPKRTRLFRLLAREDLRHFLKHKRTYRPDDLTARERAILARPAWTARLWRATGKRVYLWLTRRVLGWSDREGAGDRGGQPR